MQEKIHNSSGKLSKQLIWICPIGLLSNQCDILLCKLEITQETKDKKKLYNLQIYSVYIMYREY